MTEADVLRYDMIPRKLFSGNILEIGARNGEAQLCSRHRDAFLQSSKEARYLGLDILRPDSPELMIIPLDFLDYDRDDQTYDLVLMLEVIEHISLRNWPLLFQKTKSCLRPNGKLFLTTPFNESAKHLKEYLPLFKLEPMGGHVVYSITPDMIRLFLPNAKCRIIRKRFPFKTSNECWLRALARFIKRVLLHQPLAFNWLKLELNALVVLWTKPKTKQDRGGFLGEGDPLRPPGDNQAQAQRRNRPDHPMPEWDTCPICGAHPIGWRIHISKGHSVTYPFCSKCKWGLGK